MMPCFFRRITRSPGTGRNDGTRMKKWILILCVCLLLAGVAVPLAGCRSAAPTREEVFDLLVARIEQAVDVNTVVFGVGLPVFAREGAEEQLIHRYYGSGDDSSDYVMTPYARFAGCAEIEAAIRSVYSTAYADSLCTSLLTGFTLTASGAVMPARYLEKDGSLRQSNRVEPTVTGTRLYEYDSLEILPDSRADYLHVSIRSRSDSPSSVWKSTSLYFVLQNGEWFLNGPSC